MKPEKLPIGISSFERLREGIYLYVDKTEHICKLINSGDYYFLARPRRFGKSLLVSVLESVFRCKKELFKGLWIADSNWNWKPYPVIKIDFNQIAADSPENLEKDIQRTLTNIGLEYGLHIATDVSLKQQFRDLVVHLKTQTNERVVLLIDEYDKPIVNHLGKSEKDLEIARQHLEILRSFYGTIKGGEMADCLRFVLFTGVSKFSKVSVFSELNNLCDITMDNTYSDLLGITSEELKYYFKDYLSEFAEELNCTVTELIQKLEAYYNGYRFSSKNIKVYNPFSLLNCFAQKQFKTYWFETGTPMFLVNLLKEKAYYLPELENFELSEADVMTYDIEKLTAIPLLFQTGYLTIKKADSAYGIYHLGYPNKEVKTSFLKMLCLSFTDSEEDTRYIKIARYLKQGDTEKFIKIITSLFADIPYTLNYQLNEAHFHTLFYLMVSASGMIVTSEVLTSEGRIDLLAEVSDKIYIMEFKCNQSADKAIEQIRNKNYYQKFLGKDKKIYLMGINFDTEKRNIKDWKVILYS